MTTQTLKKIAEYALSKAKELLYSEGAIAPVVLGVTEGGSRITPTVLGADMTPEDTTNLMAALAKASEGIIFISDTWTADLKEGEQPPAAGISAHPSAVEALVIAIYTPEYVGLRRLIYGRKDEKPVIVMDLGWEDNAVIEKTRFTNPFTTVS